MLRTSLRSSQKLQQLANKPVPSGVVNEAFAVEEAQQATAVAAAAAAAEGGAESKPSAETPSKVIGECGREKERKGGIPGVFDYVYIGSCPS